MKVLINCTLKFDLNNKDLNILGGIESLNIALAKKLSVLNFDITISSICNKVSKHKNLLNIPIKTIHSKKEKLNFDIIISSNDAQIFNYFPNSKKIFWLHNPLQIEKSIRKKQFIPIIKNRPTAIFVSNYLQNITSNFYFFKKKKIISNFLLPQFEIVNNYKKRKDIFVWSVQRDKGLVETIEMWVKNIYPISKTAQFYIVGIDKLPSKYTLRFLASKNIIFLGRVSKDKLRNIYIQSTAMICLGYDETFCLNALEANSCGLPVITFGKTALKELVINNYNGFLIDDFNQLSKKILLFLNMNYSKKKNLLITLPLFLKNTN